MSFHWTDAGGGLFLGLHLSGQGDVRTDDDFIEQMVAEYGLVVIPMYDFYPPDARVRNPAAGFDQLRISFCFSESEGDERRRDLTEAVAAFCRAVKRIAGIS